MTTVCRATRNLTVITSSVEVGVDRKLISIVGWHRDADAPVICCIFYEAPHVDYDRELVNFHVMRACRDWGLEAEFVEAVADVLGLHPLKILHYLNEQEGYELA